MQATEITPELTQMNRFWYMLAGTITELDMALDHGEYTAEERLVKVRAIYEFLQSHMPPVAPPSVQRESMARDAERTQDDNEYYVMNENGEFEGPFTFTEEDGAPFTREQDAAMRAEWERTHAR
jgi:hypothetical protein